MLKVKYFIMVVVTGRILNFIRDKKSFIMLTD